MTFHPGVVGSNPTGPSTLLPYLMQVDQGGRFLESRGDPVDSLKVLRFDAGLSVSQAANCPKMGSEVVLVE